MLYLNLHSFGQFFYSSEYTLEKPLPTKEVHMDFDRAYADYIDEKGVAAIEDLEKETGKRILAYYSPPKAANLSEEQLKRIKDLEAKLCVRLVAYDSH